MKHTVIVANGKEYLTLIKACKGEKVNYNNVKMLKPPFEYKGVKFSKLNVEQICIDTKTQERTLTLENGKKVKL